MRRPFFSHLFRIFQRGQDRTVRPFVSYATVAELLQGIGHLTQVPDPLFQVSDMRLCKPFHVSTLSRPVIPQTEQFADLRYRKAEVSGAPDEAQAVHVTTGVRPVTRLAARRMRLLTINKSLTVRIKVSPIEKNSH